jgi:hypothetical protein
VLVSDDARVTPRDGRVVELHARVGIASDQVVAVDEHDALLAGDQPARDVRWSRPARQRSGECVPDAMHRANHRRIFVAIVERAADLLDDDAGPPAAEQRKHGVPAEALSGERQLRIHGFD